MRRTRKAEKRVPYEGRITPKLDFSRELGGLFDLSGKAVFIPGGYGGLGEAMAWGLALRGARVAIAGRKRERANALAERLKAAGHEAVGIRIDATRTRDIGRAVDAVIDAFGRLDVLLNCVGIQIEQPIAEVTEEAFDKVYASNLKAAMFLAQAAAKRQIEGKRGGKQVHLLSVRAKLGIRFRGYSAYCATKGGLAMLIKQHAMELAPHRVNVNGIAPTFVYTEMIRHVMENPKFRRALYSRIPLGRIADPKDVVGPAIFFASPASDFVTGQVLYVDGGITASQ
ncbi:MAG TPA: SDR family oxidoreductase [Alphaproteobacteria bacterium]|nr:SDR family oxidoreductase [Alphaproteobacteria bacterium]